MSISDLRQQKQQKENERNTLSRRKEAVDIIGANVDVGFDISNYNNALFIGISALESGIKGSSHATAIVDEMYLEVEEPTPTDEKLSSSRSYLTSESTRLQNEIDTLNSQISSLEWQIREAEEAEAAAAAAAAEAAQKLLGLQM